MQLEGKQLQGHFFFEVLQCHGYCEIQKIKHSVLRGVDYYLNCK